MYYNCREVARLNSEAFDRRLGLWERIARRVHLAFCPPCCRHRQQLATLHEAAAKLAEAPPETAGAAMPAEARERLRERLHRGG